MGSIINGFALPLKEEHKDGSFMMIPIEDHRFISKTPMKLHELMEKIVILTMLDHEQW